MKAVRLTRANGVNERIRGDAHTVLVLDDADAHFAVQQELAVYVDVCAVQVLATSELTAVSDSDIGEHGPVSEMPDDVFDDLADHIEHAAANSDFGSDPRYIQKDIERSRPEPAAEMKRPYGNASKAAWIAWAVHGDHGQPKPTPEEAAGLTKTELMSRYGERL